MNPIKSLPVSRLHATLPIDRVPWEDSAHPALARLTGSGRSHFQPRAMQALDLALQIDTPGFNIYVSGEPDLGRSHMLLSYLKPQAAKSPPPPDIVYAYNFAEPDAPLLLELPAGSGRKLQAALAHMLGQMREALEMSLQAPAHVRKRARFMDEFAQVREELTDKMKKAAARRGFELELDDTGGVMLSRIPHEAKDEDAQVPLAKKKKRGDIRHGRDCVAREIMGWMRELNQAEETLRNRERSLESSAMQDVLGEIFSPFVKCFAAETGSPALAEYLTALGEDLLQNADYFLAPHPQAGDDGSSYGAIRSSRYQVNVFVDSALTGGAPIVVEDNPNPANLLGCIERESEMGALVTDHMLVRAGSLQRANGGFLILHAEDLLRRPLAWEGLLRALRSGLASVEENPELPDMGVRTKSLRPQPLKLQLKVALIGTEDLYEELLQHEERFSKLFRIKAHMSGEAVRTSQNVRHYIATLAHMGVSAALLPFDRTALAWLVDLGSHLCEDQRRLSLRFPVLRELMVEASGLARSRGEEKVGATILAEAYESREYRANLVEELFMEDYDREMIKLSTTGQAIGQVNGLSVTWQGDYEFGLPHRISCTVGAGHDGIIDLEREAELGGPIHTKAMMILKSFLTNLFARKKPLVLSASLYFEQSYAGIEGDSASGAELTALLSALAEVPVRLDLAFTGAVSHTGQIMAVGGVTRKVEGFYKVCKRRKLTGSQGVLIPADNVDHLMLSDEVLASVEKGEFGIFPVRNMEEALLLLTGQATGKRRKNGSFTPGSLYDLVDRRLENLGAYSQGSFRRRKE